MIQILAIGLEYGNPLVYLFLFILFEPPIMIIIFYLIDCFKEWKKGDKK